MLTKPVLTDYILNTSRDNDTLELYTAWNSEEDFLLLNKTELLIEHLTIENLILSD